MKKVLCLSILLLGLLGMYSCNEESNLFDDPNPMGQLGTGGMDANSATLSTVEPIIIGPDAITAGLASNFNIYWGSLSPSYYTISWYMDGGNFEIENLGQGTVSIHSYEVNISCSLKAIISGKYNGYQKIINKEFYVNEREGYGSILITIDNSSYSDLNFTLHGSDLADEPVPWGLWDFAAQAPIGEQRFRIECLPTASAPYPIETISFDVELTQKGAHMAIEVEDVGLYMINFSNNSFEHKGFQWYYN